jgi:hypothetical protein
MRNSMYRTVRASFVAPSNALNILFMLSFFGAIATVMIHFG